MTNLQRVQAKIFAGNAPATEVGQFGSAITGTKVETTDIATIQELGAYSEGWSAAVISDRNYPTLQEMNGVLKVLSYQTAYAMQKGVPEWNSNTTYYIGDICKGVGNGNLYISKTNSNIGNALTDSTYWTLLDLSNNANIDLSNLSSTGEAKFTNLSNAIATNSASITSLTTTVNGKISASVKKASNGYIKFNNGIIMQWGKVADFSGEKTITLPVAFSSTNYSVVAGVHQVKGDYTANWATYTYTTTTFIVQNQSSGSKPFTWLAIGY